MGEDEVLVNDYNQNVEKRAPLNQRSPFPVYSYSSEDVSIQATTDIGYL